ncbi:Gas vesicle protein [Natronincola peptidivorans]|uniref:Gas vesicle protein n=1 Tax=Natronincola peptidivorans TaxID=426128 RepID=A0A1I0G7L2_9FIRM|nr:YtxH domain-containing protein [Natronincola peptidivorans]SET65898.1 Gas vesicle protein [Natronincola peptidivorans]
MDLNKLQKKTQELKQLLDPKRAEKQKQEEKKKAMTKGLALGALLGSVAGIFFAPDKGENTRKKTKEELEKIKDNLQTNIVEGKEKLDINLAEGKEKLAEVYEDKKVVFSEKVSAIKEKVKSSCEPNVVEEEELEEKKALVEEEV